MQIDAKSPLQPKRPSPPGLIFFAPYSKWQQGPGPEPELLDPQIFDFHLPQLFFKPIDEHLPTQLHFTLFPRSCALWFLTHSLTKPLHQGHLRITALSMSPWVPPSRTPTTPTGLPRW